jgi:hypothetical protein
MSKANVTTRTIAPVGYGAGVGLGVGFAGSEDMLLFSGAVVVGAVLSAAALSAAALSAAVVSDF